MKIVFCAPHKDSQPWLVSIAASLPSAEVWAWTADDSRQADYAIVWAPPEEFFTAQKKLKAVFTIGAGVDSLMKLENLPAGIPIVRLNDAGMAVQMAEYVCHALIRHSREFDSYAAQSDKAMWNVRRPIDRAAWPVGVMGLGSIGVRVAQAVAGFEYPVFGWSRGKKSIAGVTTFAGAENLDKFLQSVRVLVCLLPLTGETKHILNKTTLAKLKPQAYLINVARGQQLVDADLLALLDNGTLAGATLDVFQTEPLPHNHIFWRHPKITITPHCSAITLLDESVAQIVAKIRALEKGQRIDGLVSRQDGY